MNKQTYAPLVDALKKSFDQRLKAVVLFGSRARGEAAEGSDHDVMLVVENLPAEPVRRVREVRLPLMTVDLYVNTIAKTPRELEADLTPLLMDICVDGIPLFGEDCFEPLRAKGLWAIRQSGLVRERIGRDFLWHFPDYRHRNWELTWEGYHEVA